MFKPHYGICEECSNERLIVVKAGICEYCNDTAKKEKKGKGSQVSKSKKREPTGELQMFLEIWNERPKVSEVSGRPLLPLGHKLWINQFSHILPKGNYGRYRLRKDNIKMVLPDEHDMWEHHKSEIRDVEIWKWVFIKADELREEYFKK